MRTLIVEDNPELAENVHRFLSKEGYTCSQAFSYHEAQEKLSLATFDAVVLDIMLPDGNGLHLLEELSEFHASTSVLIISAKNALEDRLNGLDWGADDYLTKPFHLSELNSRLKAIYRRKNFNQSKEIVFNEIKIVLDTYEVSIHDKLLNITQKEYELLLYFLANKNRVLTKASIAEHLWGEQVDLYDSFDFVYQHIKNLRKKITQAGGVDYISTRYGVGYRFNTRKG